MIKKLIKVITIFALTFALLALLTNLMTKDQPEISLNPDDAFAITCFYKGEEISGLNKICYYDCLGSRAAITISSVELCPLTINR